MIIAIMWIIWFAVLTFAVASIIRYGDDSYGTKEEFISGWGVLGFVISMVVTCILCIFGPFMSSTVVDTYEAPLERRVTDDDAYVVQSETNDAYYDFTYLDADGATVEEAVTESNIIRTDEDPYVKVVVSETSDVIVPFDWMKGETSDHTLYISADDIKD